MKEPTPLTNPSEGAVAAFASDPRFLAILESGADVISLLDADARLLFVSPSTFRIFGFGPSVVIIGKPMVNFIHPDDREAIRGLFERALAAPGTTARGRARAGHQNGTWRLVEGSFTNLLEAPGIGAVVGNYRDITDEEEAQRRLVIASRQAGMAEVASNVLHNVGNVLNGVNISAELVATVLRSSSVASLDRLCGLLQEHEHDLASYLATHPQGKQLPGFLNLLARQLTEERANALRELHSLQRSINHIEEVIGNQQDHARRGGVLESISAAEIMEDALRINASSMQRHGIRLVRKFAEPLLLRTDKHQVLQILVNLLRNACDALREGAPVDRVLTAELGRAGEDRLWFVITDSGIGIAAENLPRLFEHGFTTRIAGHGFGLHSAALLAQDLGGTLAAESAGLGCGATFRLELPLESPKRREEP